MQLSIYFPEFLINLLSFVYLPFNCSVQIEVFCFVILPAFEGKLRYFGVSFASIFRVKVFSEN